MDKSDKKKMIEAYKVMQHPMGVFFIGLETLPTEEPKVLIQAAPNLKAAINGNQVKLRGGFHPYRELLADWKVFGEAAFEIKILEELEYDEDVPDKDYKDELEILKELWIDKFLENGIRQYKR